MRNKHDSPDRGRDDTVKSRPMAGDTATAGRPENRYGCDRSRNIHVEA